MKLFFLIANFFVIAGLVNIPSAKAGSIDLSAIKYNTDHYKLVGACINIEDESLEVILRSSSVDGEVFELASQNSNGSLVARDTIYVDKLKNTSSKLSVSHKSGIAFLSRDLVTLNINKKSGRGKYHSSSTSLGDLMMPSTRVIDVTLKDCTFVK